ncbi:XdhC family protein [bacterium]|nr:XdhC family protein [bacterium]
MKDIDIFEEIVRVRKSGIPAALATIVDTKGSTPGKVQARMIVKLDGTFIGTVGGGCVEAEVWQAAKDVILTDKARTVSFLLNDENIESGLICGGKVKILIEPLTKPSLFIFGAGHVGFCLYKIAKMIDFNVFIVDDRKQFANKSRFLEADGIFVENFETIFDKLPINANSYLVVVTRGHKFDETALLGCCRTKAKYIGMIGSRKKIRTIFTELREKGISQEVLDRVHAPIGLDIGSQSVEEIAISIGAELIKIRREFFVRNKNEKES